MTSSSSSSSRKRKTSETIEDTRRALEDALEVVDMAKQCLHSILHIVKDQMQKKSEAHALRLRLANKAAKCSVVQKIARGELNNLEAAALKYGDESEALELALSLIKVPAID